MTPLAFLTIYLVGLMTSLITLSIWGKQVMGVDYDNMTNKDEYDWNSNSTAYCWWSAVWFVFWAVHGLRFLFILGGMFSNYIYRLFNGDENHNKK